MIRTTELTRRVWLHLLKSGGRWTAAQVAEALGQSTDTTSKRLTAMEAGDLIAIFPPEGGKGRKRYGITGNCRVPVGMTVAEAQAC